MTFLMDLLREVTALSRKETDMARPHKTEPNALLLAVLAKRSRMQTLGTLGTRDNTHRISVAHQKGNDVLRYLASRTTQANSTVTTEPNQYEAHTGPNNISTKNP
jgi:hypothetical protein